VKKKTQHIILTIAICVAFVFVVLGAWLIFKSGNKVMNKANVEWYDENGTEFVITTADELYGVIQLSEFYDFEGQTIKLGADIIVNEGDAKDWAKKAPSRKWFPITGFKGTFDGQGHTISGLYGKSLDSGMGLFCDTQRGAVIRNFQLLNSYFSGSSEGTGSISGYGGGTFDTIYTDAIITTNYAYAGGIIGQISASGEHKISNCWFDGDITMKSEEGIYGGCISGAISGEGGIVSIEHTLNTGSVSAEGSSRTVGIGGFCGTIRKGAVLNVTDSLNAGNVETKYDKLVGAFIGDVAAGSKLIASHMYSVQESYIKVMGYQAGSVTGTAIVYPNELLKGYGGYQWSTLDFENYWAVSEDTTPVLKHFAKEVPSLAGIEKCYDVDWYNEFGTEFTISSLKEFYGFYILSANDNFEGKIVKQGADLIVNEGKASEWGEKAPENPWYPINTFAGVFDGQGYTISGLYAIGNNQKMGMFAETTSGASIQNVILKNSYFEFTDTTMALLGSIAGRGNGMFDTIYSDAILVCSGTGCGGIVGQVNVAGAQISNCWFDGEIQMKGENGRQVGGILGITRSEVDIDHCLNTSKITVETKGGIRAAGILGIATGGEFTVRITDCLTAGRIYAANSRIGAAVGEIQAGKTAIIRDVYAISETLSADEGKTFIHKPIGYIAPEVEATDTTDAVDAAIANGSAVMIPEAGIKGYLGYQWTTLNFDKFWSVDLKGTPILTSFAENSPSVAGMKKKIDISWYNEDADSYTIKTAEQLNGFFIVSALTDFEGKTVKLGRNITVNAGNAATWSTKRPTDMWYPINTFAGTFNGNGYTISGLYLKSATQKIGLFGETTPKAVVKNFRLTNSYMESTSTGMALLGSIAGRGDGIFDTIYSDAIIVCSGTGCGGIVGQVYTEGKNKITNCWYDGEMSITTDMGKQVGGILGVARTGVTIEHCLNTADINMEAKAALRVGGILGIITGGGDYTVSITDSLSAGNITTENSRVGAIVAEVQTEKKLVLKDTYALAEGMTTGKAYIKKLIGHVDKTATTEGAAALIPTALLKGTNASQWTTLDFAKYWGAKTDSTPELLSFTSGNNLNVNGLAKKSDISWYNLNADEFVIDSVEDLYGFYIMSNATNFNKQTVKLGANLDVNTGNAADWAATAPKNIWYPINTFAGTFDGQGHRISGLYLKSSEQMLGLFSQTGTASTVKNLKITNSYMESTSTGMALLGSFAGRGNGTFDTIYSDAILASCGTGNGGLVGQIYYKDTKVNNAWFDGSITLTTKMGVQVGGIVGIARQSAKLSNCLNTGIITVEHDGGIRAAGILGILTGDEFAVEMNNCLTTGRIYAANSRVGAVVGEVQEKQTLNMNEVYAVAETSYDGSKYITKIVGHSDGTIKGTGVIVPESSFTGSGAYLWTTFDFDKVWAAKADSTPELQSFTTSANLPVAGGMRADTSWYAKKDYNIKTLAELYGLAKLSWIHDFDGITITLGKIDGNEAFALNDELASDWALGTNLPADKWISIGTVDKPFAGTFDGRGNTISGVYMKTVGKHAGLFAAVTGTVKNLNLTNSYFEFNGEKDGYLGSVVGSLAGSLNTVSSDAIVYSNGLYTGGLVGIVADDATLNTCWFNGTVTLEKDKGQYAAGLIGEVSTDEDEDVVTIEHCLNTGVVIGERTDSEVLAQNKILGLSGFCAWVYKGKLEISDSLHTGTINATCPNADSRYVYLVARGEGLVSCENTYYCNDQGLAHAVWGDKCTKVNGTKGLSSEALKGAAAQLNGVKLSKLYWIYPQGETPQLDAFSDLGTVDLTWEGEGTESSPWIISTSDELIQFAEAAKGYNFSGKYIKLKNNIDIDATWLNWTPIGTQNNAFAGNFDGNGKTISGIKYKGNGTYIGLFGHVGATGSVSNLTLANSSFETTNTGIANIGAIVGRATGGTYTKIKVDSTVTVKSTGFCNGGIAGSAWGGNAKFSDCLFAGTLEMTGETGRQGGGIVGRVYGGGRTITIEHCLNTGTITATASQQNNKAAVGGLCGHLKDATLIITDSVNANNVDSQYTHGGYVGAIIGWAESGTIELTQVYGINEQKENSSEYYDHELIGTNGGTLSTNSVDYKVLTEDEMKGDVAWIKMSLDFEGYWNPIDGKLPELKSFPSGGTVLTKWEGEGTSLSPWIIKNKADLEQLAALSAIHDFAGQFIALGTTEQAGKLTIKVNDADTVAALEAAKPANWAPIGSQSKPFAGTFDGRGNTISGVYYKGNTKNVGLFGYVSSSGVIQNVGLTISYFENTNTTTNAAVNLGSIVGHNAGTLERVKSDATIKSNGRYNGGLVGEQVSGSITHCWYDGAMVLGDLATFSGGIVGRVLTGTIELNHCLFSKTISGANTNVTGFGGLVGIMESGTLKINDSLVSGSVTTGKGNHYGSFIGRLANGALEISNTYTHKTIGSNYVIRRVGGGTIKYNGTQLDVTSSTYVNGVKPANYAEALAEANLKGNNALNTKLDFINHWQVVEGGFPVLKSPISGATVVEWTGEGTESSPYIIDTKEELELLARRAMSNSYADTYFSIGTPEQAGQLIITINDGDTIDEVKASNPTNWLPIGSESVPFAGNFNGNGNTISGLYYKGTGTNIGLFGYTANSSTISNLKLSKTCYFESENSNTTARIGSVAGCVQGTLDTIKSEATVVSIGHENGGIAGTIRYSGAYSATVKPVKFTNVWFDGTLTMTTAVGRFSGGMIGKIYAPNREIVLEHCLVTGTITAARTVSNSQLGGMIGQANDYRSLSISDSLVASVVQNVNSDTGAIIGTVNEPNAYTLNGVYGVDGKAVNGTTYDHGITGTATPGTVKTGSVYGVVDIDAFKTGSATTLLPGLSIGTATDDYWLAVPGSTPILKCFSN